ncbi:hypothetical protein [Shinella sp.]|uniref:hypothetical protein n=1 Tax=Shinella sp. TaxID=1870904 RepID=UPI004036F46B
MKRIAIAVLASGLALMQADKAVASEEQFLSSLEGKYEGKGQVRLRTNRGPITVTCSFRSTATETTLSLSGKCQAREINGDRSANLSVAKSGSRGLTLTTTDRILQRARQLSRVKSY